MLNYSMFWNQINTEALLIGWKLMILEDLHLKYMEEDILILISYNNNRIDQMSIIKMKELYIILYVLLYNFYI